MPRSPTTSPAVTPSDPAPPPQGCDGTSPFQPDGPAPARSGSDRLYVTVTAVIVVLPFVAIGLAGRHGTHLRGQSRGLLHAHVGRLFRNDRTPPERYAPDLLADRDIRAVARAFPALCVLTLALPFAVGWAIGGTWVYGVTALLWAGLVRIALLHHVTWSVNSLCHLIGERPFRTRRHDRATHLWPPALLSFGESRHNLHHADPTSARHGVDRGQLDPSAAAIRLLERLGWVYDVRRPTAERVEARRA
ncbi:acyl-CoA desaturase [Streptomyces sp. NPDC086080]|uniref:acyl-CoA desaturase n=1 Tax=Streptomyces sp. NPDC086080 TaxID=3365748 RepID=UPI0037CE66B3